MIATISFVANLAISFESLIEKSCISRYGSRKMLGIKRMHSTLTNHAPNASPELQGGLFGVGAVGTGSGSVG